MGLTEIFLIGIGLSMDAFAVSVCKGLSVNKIKPKHCFITGLYFGGFQALMPFLGYILGAQFKSLINKSGGIYRDVIRNAATEVLGVTYKLGPYKKNIETTDDEPLKALAQKLKDLEIPNRR